MEKYNIDVFKKICEFNSEYNYLFEGKIVNYKNEILFQKDTSFPTIFFNSEENKMDVVKKVIKKLFIDYFNADLTKEIMNNEYFETKINPIFREFDLKKDIVNNDAHVKKKKI